MVNTAPEVYRKYIVMEKRQDGLIRAATKDAIQLLT